MGFKRKRNQDGSVAKFKARLTVKGYLQVKDFDFTDTFAPVFKQKTLRILLTIANQYKMIIHQMDVKTAFLNGELFEEIYIEQPKGSSMVKDNQGKPLVCKLKKSLYGLKQAPRCWNKKIEYVFSQLGFFKSVMEHAVFYKKTANNGVMYLALYVDDILLISEEQSEIDAVKQQMNEKFQMTDLGEAKVILNMQITGNKNLGVLALDQKRYTEDILKKVQNG